MSRVPLLRLQVLGPVRVIRTDTPEPTSVISQPRRLALLAYLALARPRGLHSRDVLIALLWPDADQEGGRHALRNALHAIRRALGPQVIVTEGDGLVGVDRTVLSCDAIDLEEAITAGRAEAVAELRDGLLMAGFHVSDAPEFSEWLDGERRRFDEVILSATWSLSEALERQGDGDGAIAVARRACTLAPYDERSLRRLIELLDKRGEAAAAVRAYQDYALRLERELGVAPSPAIARVADGIRARRQPLDTRGASAATSAPTSDTTSYIHYVRGTYLFLRAAHRGTVDDLERSRALFEEALACDPNFALAYAGLSNYFAVCAARNILRPFEAAFGRAIALSKRALELDASLAIPHVHFGVKAMYLDNAWEDAGREFQTAVAFDPSYAEARRFLGIWYDAMGRGDEALTELREAVRIEPQIAMFRNTLAAALMDRGRWTEAMAELERACALDPDYRAARERLVRCAEELGRYDIALAQRERDPRIGPVEQFRKAFDVEGPSGYARIARDELREMIPDLEARASQNPPDNAADLFNPPALRLAVIHARLGEWEAARRWEEAACRARPGLRPWFRSRPELRAQQGAGLQASPVTR